MIINTVDSLTKLLEDLKKEGNLLYPLTFCDSIAPMHRVSVRRLTIDPDPDYGEIYHPKQAPSGKFALTKIALLKIDLAAGLDWIGQLCHRTDNGLDQFFCTFSVSAKIQDLDGSHRTVSAAYTLDYRQGSIMIDGLTSGDVRMRRMSIVQRAETAAKNRVRRDCVGLKPTYSKSELDKPFIVLKLVQNLPQGYENAMAASLLGMDQSIFGKSTQIESLPDKQEVVNELVETQDQQEPNPVVTKEDIIKECEKLYLEKLGSPRPANRPPLSSLGDDQLKEVMQALLAMEKK
jgi:hypothetical protein